MKFTVVIPIRNEEKNLVYSLPSVYKLNPDEVILLFDRCTDNSLRISKRISKDMGSLQKTKSYEMNKPSPEWRSRIAFLRNYGYKLAKNDIILTTDADMIIDSSIRGYLNKIGQDGVALISLGFLDYPYTFQTFSRRIISSISPFTGFAGFYAFSKEAWLETEDLESVRHIPSAEDTHLRMSILKKYKGIHKNTNSIHIRPNESIASHYLRGILYWQIVHDPMWKMLLHSSFMLRPATMAGYIHARYFIEKP